MSYYVIVRGPLGAGKTTVARALATEILGEVISVDDIVDPEGDGGSEALFLRANAAIEQRVRPALDRGIPVVIEGNFYWESVLDDLVDRLPGLHEVFTLQVPVDICIARDGGRSPSHGSEAAREVHAKVAGLSRGISVDATRPVVEIVSEIRARLPA